MELRPPAHYRDGDTGDGGGSPWSSETNWTVVYGSLETSIAFESSDSSIEYDSTTPKPPLVLRPPSPISGHCEIKMNFKQKHEIRQVYVRSTARVYEIYCATSPHSCNDYLCTVRCDVAERDGELLQATKVEELAREDINTSVEKLSEKRVSGGNIDAGEDDWVDVKAPDSQLLGQKISSLPEYPNVDIMRNIQDFYEATAQISDSDPCTSLTIRLLSLQEKSNVYIDELYVFADPVEPSDSDSQPVPSSPAQSSLMAMLVPSLLQLSKSGIGKVQDKNASYKQNEINEVKTGDKIMGSTEAENAIHHDVKSTDGQRLCKSHQVDNPTADPSNFLVPKNDESNEKHDDSDLTNDKVRDLVENILEQLTTRVSRIEDICLRFEENMLKPIISMEQRLQHVEQQLEILAKNTQKTVVSTRFSAPSFSGEESNSSSLYNERNDNIPHGASEAEPNDFPSNNLSNPSSNTSIPVNTTHCHPSLVVAAPEFSCSEDEDDNKVVERLDHSVGRKQKQSLSIDDALAAALSGFLSTSKCHLSEDSSAPKVTVPEFISEVDEKDEQAQPPTTVPITVHKSSTENFDLGASTYTQVLIVAAPEFTAEENCENDDSNHRKSSSATEPELTIEDDGKDNIVAPSSSDTENVKPVALGNFDDSNGNGKLHGLSTSPAVGSSSVNEGRSRILLDEVHFRETAEVDIVVEFSDATIRSRSLTDSITSPPNEANELTKLDVKIDGQASLAERDSVFLPEGASPISSDSTETIAGVVETSIAEGPSSALLQNEYEISMPSVVDFDIPILDVQFTFHGNSGVESSLEVLLGDDAELNSNDPSVSGENVDGFSDDRQTTFIVINDDESACPAMNGDLLVYSGPYATNSSSHLEVEQQDKCSSSMQEMFIGLL